jgi:putative ABC transport system permease protein
MDAVLRDLRYAVRMLLRTPGVTAAAVLALALGIGATTSIFSVVHAVLLRSLGWGEESRLVAVRGNFEAQNLIGCCSARSCWCCSSPARKMRI